MNDNLIYTMSEPDFSSNKIFSVVEKMSVVVYFIIILIWFLYLCIHFWSLKLRGYFLLVFFIGGFLADCFTGLIHWLCDTYGAPTGGAVSDLFVAGFRWHHVRPTAMVEYSLWINLGSSCLLGLFVLFPLYCLFGLQVNLLILVICFNFFIFSSLTNLFHRWAHDPKRNRLIRLLQRCRLILPPSHHAAHHQVPFNQRYCITNGWANPLLDKIAFWRGLERLLKCLGIHPHPSSKVRPDVARSTES
jgi:hypothetical protein